MSSEKYLYERALDLLKENKSVTHEQARKQGVYFFQQRVDYLRQKGYDIEHVGYREYALKV